MPQNPDTSASVLLVMTGPNMTRRIPLDPNQKPVHIIGRGSADIVLLDPLISARHAELAWSEGSWVVRDLSSTVGTFVNAIRITTPQPLGHNDKIRCGSTTLVHLNYAQAADAPASAPALAAQDQPQSQPISAQPQPIPDTTVVESEFFEQLNSALSGAVESKDLLNRIAKVLLIRPAVDCVYVVLKDASGNLLPLIELQKTQTHCLLYSSMIDQALADRKPLYVENIANYKSLSSVAGLQSVLIIPLQAKTQANGIIYLGSLKISAFPAREINTLYTTGSLAALHMENLELSRTARQHQRLSDAGQTAANLSHTIKNIIQAIGGATEVMDFAFEKNQIPRARSSWEILKKNVNRIKKFSLDMLALTRETKAIFTNCRFNKLVESAVESLKSSAAEKGVTIDLQMDNSIPEGQLDVDKMHDVILNLVMNAIDAVEPEKGHISVTTCCDLQNQRIMLSVKDNGPGIKPDDIEKIFQPFHTTKQKTGTGLGLAIVKRVIELHNGSIEVDPTPNSGANFIVTLPLNSVS